jgi:hypothetical protein
MMYTPHSAGAHVVAMVTAVDQQSPGEPRHACYIFINSKAAPVGGPPLIYFLKTGWEPRHAGDCPEERRHGGSIIWYAQTLNKITKWLISYISQNRQPELGESLVVF